MKNATKAKLKAGKAAIGVRMDFTSPFVVESLAGLGNVIFSQRKEA